MQSQESVFIFLICKPANWYRKHLSVSLSHKWELLFPFQNKMNSPVENNVSEIIWFRLPPMTGRFCLSITDSHYLLKTHGDSLYNHIRHCFYSSPQRTSLSPFYWVGQNVRLAFGNVLQMLHCMNRLEYLKKVAFPVLFFSSWKWSPGPSDTACLTLSYLPLFYFYFVLITRKLLRRL